MGEKDWGAQAKDYGNFNSYHSIILKIFDILSKKINFKKKKILDVGCGDGWISHVLNKKFNSEVLGVDISEELIEKASREYSNIKTNFLVRDAREISKIDDKFDYIFMNTLLCNISSEVKIKSILEAAHKILNKSGKLVILNPHPCFENLTVRGVRERIYKKDFNYFQKGQTYSINLYKKDGSYLVAKNYHYPLQNFFNLFNLVSFNVEELMEFNFPQDRNKPYADYILFILSKR